MNTGMTGRQASWVLATQAAAARIAEIAAMEPSGERVLRREDLPPIVSRLAARRAIVEALKLRVRRR